MKKKIRNLVFLFMTCLLCGCSGTQGGSTESTVNLNKEDSSLSLVRDEVVDGYEIQIPQFQSQTDSATVAEMNRQIEELTGWFLTKIQDGCHARIHTDLYEDDRYLQVLIQYKSYPLVGGNADVVTYNYDRIADKQILFSDVVIELGTTMDDLKQEAIDAYLESDDAKNNEAFVDGIRVDGFLYEEGEPVFYGSIAISYANSEPWAYVYGYHWNQKKMVIYPALP